MIFRGTVAVPGRRVRSYTRVCYSLAAPNPLRAKAIASGAEAQRVLQKLKLGAQSTQHWPNRRPQGWPIGATPRKLPTCNGDLALRQCLSTPTRVRAREIDETAGTGPPHDSMAPPVTP